MQRKILFYKNEELKLFTIFRGLTSHILTPHIPPHVRLFFNSMKPIIWAPAQMHYRHNYRFIILNFI